MVVPKRRDTRHGCIYNFIVTDVVGNRVHEILEKKLSVIFEEIGIDKYSDVWDSEVADLDFTEGPIGHPGQMEENLYLVESETRQQLQNSKKYKDVIREKKNLIVLALK